MKKNQNGITILGISIILIVTLIMVGVVVAMIWKVNVEKQRKVEEAEKVERINIETAVATVKADTELALDIRLKLINHTNTSDAKLKIEIGDIVKEIKEINSLAENDDTIVSRYSDNKINYTIDEKKFRIVFKDSEEYYNGAIEAIYLVKDNKEDINTNYYTE